MSGPIEFIIFKENGEITINPKATSQLQKIQCPVTVVGIVGLYKTGKSYLMNRLAGKAKGFPLGSNIVGMTRGLWIWIIDHPTQKNTKLILLDTEGLGDVDASSEKSDVNIFVLCTLLSSQLIYNSKNNIDQTALEKISFIANMTEHVKMSSTEKETGENFDLVFPDFMWVIRDFYLKLKINDKDITSDEYLDYALRIKDPKAKHSRKIQQNKVCENIRQFFKTRKCFVLPIPSANIVENLPTEGDNEQSNAFEASLNLICDYVYSKSKEKTIEMGQKVNGRMLLKLAESYVGALNSGALPCIQNAVETMSILENNKVLEECIDYYNTNMKMEMKKCSSSEEVDELHRKISSDANKMFLSKILFNRIQEYQPKFEERIAKSYGALGVMKYMEEKYLAVLDELYEPIEKSVQLKEFIKPGGYEEYDTCMKALQDEFISTWSKHKDAVRAMKIFIGIKSNEGRVILNADRSLTDANRQIQVEKQKIEDEKRRNELLEAQNEEQVSRLKAIKDGFEDHVNELKKQNEKSMSEVKEFYAGEIEKRQKVKASFQEEKHEAKIKELQSHIDSLEEDRRKWEKSQNSSDFFSKLGNMFTEIIPQVLPMFLGGSVSSKGIKALTGRK